jgi:hypothetical protein
MQTGGRRLRPLTRCVTPPGSRWLPLMTAFKAARHSLYGGLACINCKGTVELRQQFFSSPIFSLFHLKRCVVLAKLQNGP